MLVLCLFSDGLDLVGEAAEMAMYDILKLMSTRKGTNNNTVAVSVSSPSVSILAPFFQPWCRKLISPFLIPPTKALIGSVVFPTGETAISMTQEPSEMPKSWTLTRLISLSSPAHCPRLSCSFVFQFLYHFNRFWSRSTSVNTTLASMENSCI